VASRGRRRLLAVLAAVTGALVISGCVSVPNAGPVLSYPVNQETGSQSGQNMQFIATPPGNGWNPQQIVNGFLIAAAAFGNQAAVAREYLTPAESKQWKPSWNAYVYQTRPSVAAPQYQVAPAPPSAKGGKAGKGGKGGRSAKHGPTAATVEVNGKIQATLSNHDGTYAVPSGPGSDGASPGPFQLVNTGGQWRISSAPDELLLTPAQFADDYELRNLYFFDPNYHSLVPDPVYVPLQASASTLTSDLVSYLQKQPGDWLNGGATQTAFPPPSHLKVKASLAGNLATVDVTGTITQAQQRQVASQLLWTLVGSGQSGSQVDAVELIVNGTPFGSAVNPVQTVTQATFKPATDAGSTFYYLNSAGELYSQAGVTGKPVAIAKVGTKLSQIAVSKDGKYLAALSSNGALFIGPIRGPLVREPGANYATLSWDPTDNLWAATATNAQIYVFRTGASPDSRQAKPISVTVTPGADIPAGGQFTALQIAPDGVRVAMVIDSDELTFGAIVWEPGTGPGLGSVKIVLSPFSVNDFASLFTAVTWYGPDNVITLGGPGSTLTEYPVSGGTPTSQMLDQTVESITASGPGWALIAGIANDQMIEASSLTGAWTSIVAGPTDAQTPVKGNSPTYPG
jgi:Lipoprotein LpqB beta-propeller domain/Sporulation and spore germination